MRTIRRAIVSVRPDVVISFIDLTNVTVLMATRGLGVPVIVSERIDPHHHAIGRLANALRRITYPSAARIVVQTERAAQFFTGYPASKLVILANPVPAATAHARPAESLSNGRWRIIGVGRLDPQKGFDLLVKAFARLAARFPEWDVVIFGQGPERAALLAAVEAHGLTGRFEVAAPTTQVAAELAASHVFAFPSRYEGFPNALAEAMVAGLPVRRLRGRERGRGTDRVGPEWPARRVGYARRGRRAIAGGVPREPHGIGGASGPAWCCRCG